MNTLARSGLQASKNVAKSFLPERTRAKMRSIARVPSLLAEELARPFRKVSTDQHLNDYALRRNLHRLEKGLCMSVRRRHAGYDNFAEVLHGLSRDTERSDGTLAWALGVVAAYEKVLETELEGDGPLPRRAAALLERSRALRAELTDAEVESFAPKVPAPAGEPHDDAGHCADPYAEFLRLASGRHSTRLFTSEPVDEAQLLAAVEAARHFPSACNRQSTSITVVREDSHKVKVLRLQGGLLGYGAPPPLVAAVHFSRAAFPGYHERNTGYIEAGLFGMSLILALQAQGLASVPLNWAYLTPERNARMRGLLGLDRDDEVAYLIGIGKAAPVQNVPPSPKKPAAAFIRYA